MPDRELSDADVRAYLPTYKVWIAEHPEYRALATHGSMRYLAAQMWAAGRDWARAQHNELGDGAAGDLSARVGRARPVCREHWLADCSWCMQPAEPQP